MLNLMWAGKKCVILCSFSPTQTEGNLQKAEEKAGETQGLLILQLSITKSRVNGRETPWARYYHR